MLSLQMLYYPDERLRKVAKPVIDINSNTKNIVNNMLETMYTQDGIGLAATQINEHQRIIVIDISKNRNQPLVLINPELINKSGQIGIDEGCLSIPNEHHFISRYAKIKISALNIEGNNLEIEAVDLLSICIQHEMDHLIGKLFIDYLSPLKRYRIHKKIQKINRIK